MVKVNVTIGHNIEASVCVKGTSTVINVLVHVDVQALMVITTTSATSAANALAMVAGVLVDSWCHVNLKAYTAICAQIASNLKDT